VGSIASAVGSASPGTTAAVGGEPVTAATGSGGFVGSTTARAAGRPPRLPAARSSIGMLPAGPSGSPAITETASILRGVARAPVALPGTRSAIASTSARAAGAISTDPVAIGAGEHAA
jgi:hypothetical protein